MTKKYNAIFIAASNSAFDVYFSLYTEMKKKFNVSLALVPIKMEGKPINQKKCAEKLSILFDTKCIHINTVKDLKQLKPDVVFYHLPYPDHIESILPSKQVSEFARICYIPYGIGMMDYYYVYYGYHHFQYYWKICFGTSLDLKMASDFLGDHFMSFADKMLLSGSPKLDLIDTYVNLAKEKKFTKKTDGLWPTSRESGKKRFIWAPHWVLPKDSALIPNKMQPKSRLDYSYITTIPQKTITKILPLLEKLPLFTKVVKRYSSRKDLVSTSTFMYFYKDFIEWAKKYQDQIEIVFRPHPALYTNLINSKAMTEQELEKFKHDFTKLSNTKIIDFTDEPYYELCASSDALITDGVSLFTEYPIAKPLLHTLTSTPCKFSEFGQDVVDCFYKARTKNDIEKFINNDLENKDPDIRNRETKLKDLIIRRPEGNAKFIADYIYSELQTTPDKTTHKKSILETIKSSIINILTKSETKKNHQFVIFRKLATCWKMIKKHIIRLLARNSISKEHLFWSIEDWDFQNAFPKRNQIQTNVIVKFANSIKNHKNGSILDLACDNGHYTLIAAKILNKCEFDAVDISIKALTDGKNKAESKKINNINFIPASVEHFLDISDPKIYDHVIMTGLLTCITDEHLCERIIKYIAQKTKKDGYIVLKDSLITQQYHKKNHDRNSETLTKHKNWFICETSTYRACYRLEKYYVYMFEKYGFTLKNSSLLSNKNNEEVYSKMFLMQKG